MGSTTLKKKQSLVLIGALVVASGEWVTAFGASRGGDPQVLVASWMSAGAASSALVTARPEGRCGAFPRASVVAMAASRQVAAVWASWLARLAMVLPWTSSWRVRRPPAAQEAQGLPPLQQSLLPGSGLSEPLLAL